MTTTASTPEILEGELRNIVFASDDGKFTVARLTITDGKLKTIVGALSGLRPGEYVKLQGQWVENSKYGSQFQVISYFVQSPKTLYGLERYLCSGILPGIGPKTAARMVEAFGENTLKVLESSPQQLRSIAGMSAARLEKVMAAWESRKSVSEIIVFLQSYGISPGFAERIQRVYRDQAIAILRTNPYRLAWDIHGIGFKKADQIAREMGMPLESPLRCEAAVLYLLRSFSDQGHVFYPLDQILQETCQLLEVSEEAVGTGLQLALKEGRVVLEEITWEGDENAPWRGQVLYLDKMHTAEVTTAKELKRLLAGKKPNVESELNRPMDQLMNQLSVSHGLELGDEQRAALERTLQARVSVITGGPGTGKTTMIRALVHVIKDLGQQVLLAAPTGRAAKRLGEATSLEAKTIHRLLEYRPRERQFARNRDNPLAVDWLVIDETSMVDIFLMQHLLLALPDNTSLLLVGDADQLPSVGSGNVLYDLITSQELPVSHLSHIYRQAQGSLITLNAHSINRGEFPKLIPLETTPLDDDEAIDCFFWREESPPRMLDKIRELCLNILPKRFQIDPLQEVQVITPMHKGDVGSQNLNRTLQAALNPARAKSEEIQRGERTYRLLDRVMQVRNNYDKEVFNGDIGQIVGLDLEEGEVKVRFDLVDAVYTISELDELELAYAVTVHKSQGSEYPVVILPITTQHFVMLQRNLLYTAITRGKSLVFLVGSSKAIAMAVKNDRMGKRYSLLAGRLRQPAI